MKMLLLGFVAALALAIGVAPATAAPYPGTVTTKTFSSVAKNAFRNTTPNVIVRVLPTSGNGIARGKMAVRCRWGAHVIKQSPWRNYASRNMVLTKGPRLTRKGQWRCITLFQGRGVYKSSWTFSGYVKVRR